MLRQKQTTNAPASASKREARHFAAIVVGSILFTIFSVAAVAQAALWFVAPYAYPDSRSVLSPDQADYSPWTNPQLPALDPNLAEDLLREDQQQTPTPPVPQIFVTAPPAVHIAAATPTPTPTPSSIPLATATAGSVALAQTHTPTLQPPTPTPSPTFTPSVTFTPEPSETPEATSTPRPTNTRTPTSTSVPAPGSSSDGTEVPTSTLTPTDTVTPPSTRTPRPTSTSAPTVATSTPEPTWTPEPAASSVPSRTPTRTRTPRPTDTATPTRTRTPTRTPTPSSTSTPGPTDTPESTATPEPTIPATTATPTPVPFDLRLAIDGPDSAMPGETVTYELTYETSERDTIGVVITVDLPAYVSLVANDSTSTWQCSEQDTGSRCTIIIGDVAVGEVGRVDLPLQIVDTLPTGLQQIVLQASIADDGANGTDTNLDNNQASHTIDLDGVPDLALVADDNTNGFAPGDIIRYTLEYHNHGTQNATGVTLNLQIPRDTSLESSGGSAWICTSDNLCTLTIGTVAAGERGSVSLAVRVDSTLRDSVANLVLAARIADDGQNGAEPSLADNVATTTTPRVPQVSVAVRDYDVLESDGSATISVELSEAAVETVLVNYRTQNGSAESPADYNADSGTLTFTPGNTQQTVTVPIVDDTRVEDDEYFIIELSDPSNAELGSSQAWVQIVDDDGPPRVQFSDWEYVVQEQASAAFITVELIGTATERVTVDYRTRDGSAQASADYSASSGTLTFAPGDTRQTFQVPMIDDTLQEGSEFFLLEIFSAVNADIGKRSNATGWIVDNEVQVSFSHADYSVHEDQGMAEVMVILTAPSQQNVTVVYTTADNTARAGEDYGSTIGTLLFTPGEQVKLLRIPVLVDGVAEDTETFRIHLRNATRATLADPSTATIHITDGTATSNQPIVTFSTWDYTVAEDGGSATISVMLTQPQPTALTVGYTIDGITATQGDDYSGGSGTLTFAPGEMVQSFTIPIQDDAIFEGDEFIFLELDVPSNVARGITIAHLTIIDNEPLPSAAFTRSAQGVNEGAGSASIAVGLDRISTRVVQVFYVDEQTGTATTSVDYVIPYGWVVFAAGQTLTTINVPIINDSIAEPSETIELSLQDAVNGVVGSLRQTRLIIGDDDSGGGLPTATPTRTPVTPTNTPTNTPVPPTVSFTTSSQNGQEDVGQFTIVAQLSASASQDITVPFAVSGSATSGSDYTITASPITIPAGSLTAQIIIKVNDDTDKELDETISVTMGTPTNAKRGSTISHTATIIDNDIATILITTPGGNAQLDVAEDATTVGASTLNGTTATFELALDSQPSSDVTISFLFAAEIEVEINGSGGWQADGASLTISSAASPGDIDHWQTTQIIRVRAVDDSINDWPDANLQIITVEGTSSDPHYNPPAVDVDGIDTEITVSITDEDISVCFAQESTDPVIGSVDAAAVQRAINDASSGETIKLGGECRGVITENGTDQTAYVNKDLTMRGGYETSMTGLTNYDPATYPTTLDAQNGGRVLYVGGSTVTVESLTLTNGLASGTDDGGGVFNTGTLQFNATIIENNEANWGGGIYNEGSLTLAANTIVRDNIANNYGGGMRNEGGTLTVNASTIENNYAGRNGGGIHNHDGQVTITNSTISTNVSNLDGGGIRNVRSAGGPSTSVTINSSVIENNNSNQDGGGLSNDNAQATITGGTFQNNEADRHGGGIHNDDAQVTITGGTINLNQANGNGGGIHNANGSSLTLINSQVRRNNNPIPASPPSIGAFGGGIYNDDSTIIIDNTTIAENKTMVDGGGIHNTDNGTITLSNGSTVADNQVNGDGGGIYNSDANMTIESNTIIDNNDASSDGGGIYNTNNNATLTINDSTIRQNSANGAFSDGGGIYNTDNAVLNITDSIIDNNDAGDDGGGIYNDNNGNLTITGGTISNNTANESGGGIRNSATANITGCTIEGNVTSTVNGGGIFNTNGMLVLNTSTINNNTAHLHGGGIRLSGGSATIDDTTISNNLANTGDGGGINNAGNATLTINSSTVRQNNANGAIGGGGIYNDNSDLIVTVSTINNNTATYGGGIRLNGGTGTIANTTVSTNTVTEAGGGIYNAFGAMLDIINSTISGNNAGTLGGGIVTFAATTLTTHSTITNNIASTGGGTYVALIGGSLQLDQSIIAGNQSNDCAGPTTSGGYNLIGIGTGCPLDPNDVTVDPLLVTTTVLGPLSDNGGPTLTHALLPGSPAIDAGDPTFTVPPAYDQRGTGFTRNVGVIDIGAFEVQ